MKIPDHNEENTVPGYVGYQLLACKVAWGHTARFITSNTPRDLILVVLMAGFGVLVQPFGSILDLLLVPLLGSAIGILATLLYHLMRAPYEMWRDVTQDLLQLERQLDIGASTQRPQYIEENGERIACRWYGNECRLEEPLLELYDGAITSGEFETASVVDAAANTLARLRYRLDDFSGRDWIAPPNVIIRRTGSATTPKYFGEGEVDIEIDSEGRFEYAVDLSHAEVEHIWFRVELVGWKLPE